MIRSTSRPAICPASLVAVRWASSKYAGHGDHGLGDRVAEVALGVALELHQRAGRDLLRRVALAVDVVGLPVLAHVPLDRAERAVGVGDGLALGDLADEDLAALGEGDDRRGRARALGVGDDDRVAALEDGRRRSWWYRGRCRRPWAWGCLLLLGRGLRTADQVRTLASQLATQRSQNLSRSRLKFVRSSRRRGRTGRRCARRRRSRGRRPGPRPRPATACSSRGPAGTSMTTLHDVQWRWW